MLLVVPGETLDGEAHAISFGGLRRGLVLSAVTTAGRNGTAGRTGYLEVHICGSINHVVEARQIAVVALSLRLTHGTNIPLLLKLFRAIPTKYLLSLLPSIHVARV